MAEKIIIIIIVVLFVQYYYLLICFYLIAISNHVPRGHFLSLSVTTLSY
jgi:hypothetical protein